MTKIRPTFGQVLREARLAKGITLRNFEMVGISQSYLSQVEKSNVDPPTAARVDTMARLLGANSDEWTMLAGRLPTDLIAIFHKQPVLIAELLRAASGLSCEQIRSLTEMARSMKKERR